MFMRVLTGLRLQPPGKGPSPLLLLLIVILQHRVKASPDESRFRHTIFLLLSERPRTRTNVLCTQRASPPVRTPTVASGQCGSLPAPPFATCAKSRQIGARTIRITDESLT